MEEIDELHATALEWGCITKMINRIGSIEETIEGGWDELLNMIADMVEENSQEKDAAKVFFYIYQFIFRLYYRLKRNPEKRAFNQISKITITGKEVYRITNYDYKTFKWAKENGLVMELSNDCLDLPEDKLTINQRRAFDRRIGD